MELHDALFASLTTLGLLAFALIVLISAFLAFCTPKPREAVRSEGTYRSITSDERDELGSVLAPPSCSLTVVIPAYNERERLPIMLGPALDYLEQRLEDEPGQTYEVIIVDDGSTDGTAGAALDFAAGRLERGGRNVRVVTLVENRGKGGAVKHGLVHARGQLVLYADADGASRFDDLRNLENALSLLAARIPDGHPMHGHGIIAGSRAHLVGTPAVVQRSVLRNALMRGFHAYLRVCGIRSVRDTQCGFKLLTRSTAAMLAPCLHLEGWLFDVELLLLAQFVGIPVLEVAVAWNEVPGSKLSVMRDSLRMAKDLLVVRLNYALGRWRAPTHLAEQLEDDLAPVADTRKTR